MQLMILVLAMLPGSMAIFPTAASAAGRATPANALVLRPARPAPLRGAMLLAHGNQDPIHAIDLKKPPRGMDKNLNKLKDEIPDHEEGGDITLHFGDTACPCIGFDNIEGTLSLPYEGFSVEYPADVGSRCEKWEKNRHPDCVPGGKLGPDKGFCNQPWCFVDPCNCKITAIPHPVKIMPDTLYRGKPIHYSAQTCGGEEMWNKKELVIGNPKCRCVGFTDIPGKQEVEWKDQKTGAVQVLEYPAELGASCETWDKDVHPLCKVPGEKPNWCARRWCYVDPCECDMPTPPKVTMYLPWATFTGKSLFYSYETCGNPDSFTAVLNIEACVNQKTQQRCLGLTVRNGVQKCAWIGRCLGAELVHHPLCEHLKTYEEPEYLKRSRSDIAKDDAKRPAGAWSALVLALGLLSVAFL